MKVKITESVADEICYFSKGNKAIRIFLFWKKLHFAMLWQLEFLRLFFKKRNFFESCITFNLLEINWVFFRVSGRGFMLNSKICQIRFKNIHQPFMNVFCLTFDGFHGFQAVFPTSRAQWFECEFSTDAAPSGRSVAFTGG